MAMIPKTLGEVLTYTNAFHERLAHHLVHCQSTQRHERERLLLQHLAEHEKKMADTVLRLQQDAEPGVLDTWFYEYTDRHPIAAFEPTGIDFGHKDCYAIAAIIADLHDELVDLYRHLHDRAESNTAKEMIGELLDVETSQAKLVSFESGRVQEI